MVQQNGFLNNRSGTWVSPEHASQHVGEVVNGWEKRLSVNGNYYMAHENNYISTTMSFAMTPFMFNCISMLWESMSNFMIAFQNYIDRSMGKQSRCQSRDSLLNLYKMIENENKFNNELNEYIGRKTNYYLLHFYNNRGRELLEEALNKFNITNKKINWDAIYLQNINPIVFLDDFQNSLNNMYTTIKKCFDLPTILYNPENALSDLQIKYNQSVETSISINTFIAKKSGWYCQHFISEEGRRLIEDFYVSKGLSKPIWDVAFSLKKKESNKSIEKNNIKE